MKNKLALGTVQFGLPYGVANSKGQISHEEAGAILNLARDRGITTLDTAIAYGESEQVLGSMSLAGFDIITKLPALPDTCTDVAGWIESELQGSLSRLNVTHVGALLLHRPEQLFGTAGKKLYSALQDTKRQGLVKRVGVSIYSPNELPAITEEFQFDLVQAPFSIIDARLAESGWLNKLSLAGIELHVRSVFMQGLLLMPDAARPKKFNRWCTLWSLWREWLNDTGLTPLEACLRYALSVPQIEKVMVGVDNCTQLSEILQTTIGDCPQPPPSLICSDINLLNPSLWSKL